MAIVLNRKSNFFMRMSQIITKEAKERLSEKHDVFYGQVLNGFWQYVVDHARVDFNGQLTVNFVIENRDDFYKKLKSRVYGTYRRRNVTELYNLAQSRREIYLANNKVAKFYKKSFWQFLYLRFLKYIARYCRRKIVLIDYPYMKSVDN